MKKILKTAFLFCACLCVLGLAACGDAVVTTTEYQGQMSDLTEAEKTDFTYSLVDANGVSSKNGEFVTITGLNDGYPLGMKIPEKIDGKDVISLAGGSFHRSNVVLLSIPKTIKYIGEGAFSGSMIKQIEFASGSVLETVSKYAFSNLQIESITLPNTVTSIGTDVFAGCRLLKTVVLSDLVTVISDSAFSGCSSLESVTANGVTSIGKKAFYNSNIESYTLPEKCVSIGDSAFAQCKNLKTFVFNNMLRTIGAEAFRNDSALTNIVLPSTVTTIGNYAFGDCSNIVNFQITGKLGRLGEAILSGCNALKVLGVTYDSTYLTRLQLLFIEKANLAEAGNVVPEGIKDLIIYPSDKAIIATTSGIESLENVYICASDKLGISNALFENCPNLKNIYIESVASEIAQAAFANLTGVAFHIGVAEPAESSVYDSCKITGCTIQFNVDFNIPGLK